MSDAAIGVIVIIAMILIFILIMIAACMKIAGDCSEQERREGKDV